MFVKYNRIVLQRGFAIMQLNAAYNFIAVITVTFTRSNLISRDYLLESHFPRMNISYSKVINGPVLITLSSKNLETILQPRASPL